MNWLKILVVLAAAVLFAGCVSVTKVQSVHAKAYVVDGSIFGTGMLNCDATDGHPDCWPVQENAPKGGEE